MSMTNQKPPIEFRAIPGSRLEIRDAGAGRTVVTGVAAAFGNAYDVGSVFFERLEPGCIPRDFASTRNVKALVGHAPTALLASSKNRTLRLRASARALSYEFDLPDTQLGHDTKVLIERGDLAGSSIGFAARGFAWGKHEGKPLRIVRAIDLFEISVVSDPANPATSVSVELRSEVAFRAAQQDLFNLAVEPMRAELRRLEHAGRRLALDLASR